MNIIFIMGVSGSGKSTIGELLAKELGVPFFDADDFHPIENVAKMKAGNPLNDEDRAPWLANLNQLAKKELAKKGAIITCSALKQKYRISLEEGLSNAPEWIFLNGDFELILNRINQRADHYMPASLLQSQFDTLEIPANAFEVDIALSPTVIIATILSKLGQD
ncbi:MAG: gluconokinase [Saprospiraceae bacterium]